MSTERQPPTLQSLLPSAPLREPSLGAADESELSRQRLAMLAAAGLVLARSLDYQTTLAEVAGLAVPTFADLCTVDVAEADRTIQRVAVAAASPVKRVLLEEMHDKYPTIWDSMQPAAQALRGERALLFPHLEGDRLAATTRSDEHLRILSQLAPRSVIAVPLIARGQALGAITFALAESGRDYNEEDLTLAEDLGRRCALALDNARLYSAAQKEIAERRRAEAELQAARRELEERVQERTLELARANHALVAEVGRQRHAEDALKASETRFRAVIEHSWEGVSLLAPDGTLLYTSPAAFRVLGFQPDEMTGQTAFSWVHPDDVATVRSRFAELLREPGGSITAEYRHRQKDGSWRWIESTGTNLLHEPDIRALVVNHRDVSDRKRSEEALRQSEELYRGVVEGSLQGLAIQQDGILRYVNPALARIFGYARPEELIGRHWEEVVAPEDRPPLHARASAGLQGAAPTALVVWRGLRPDGRLLWAESGMAVTTWQGRAAVLSFVIDVTERKQAEVALRESEERFNAFMNNCPLIAFIKDADSRHIYVNPSFRAAFPELGDDWQGKTNDDLFPEAVARQLRAHDRAVLTSELPLTVEEVVPSKAGDRHWMSFKFPFRDAAGKQYLAGMALNVTEQRRLEEQLRQSQKMEAVGRLAGGIAHDFNNLLTAFLGYAEIVQAELGEEHPCHPHVVEMQKAGERAALLTGQLLAFSRKQVLALRAVDLNAVLADVEPMLRRLIGEDVQLLVLPEPSLGRVRADPVQLQQVLINLVVNARDAMPRGGTLLLRTASVPLTAQACPAGLSPGPYVQLTVSDTGHGMTAEVRSHLFEPFFTTKETGKGTGLGLCTSYGIIKQCGGGIEVDSEPGAGATFRIFLPCVQEEPASHAAADSTRAPRGSETILLVEDEDIVRALVLKVLKQQGYTVLPASQGEDALRLAGQHTGPIQLLVADVVMPGMSGREVAEQMQNLRPGLRVLYLSGYTDDAVLRHGVREAEAAFLQKPFTPDALARKVREVLDNG